MFSLKQIVWAKVKGYSWWPAEISKLPSEQQNFFKVLFIGEETHAFLHEKDIKKYLNYYEENSKKKSNKLNKAIEQANELAKKRDEIITRKRKKIQKIQKDLKLSKEEEIKEEDKQQHKNSGKRSRKNIKSAIKINKNSKNMPTASFCAVSQEKPSSMLVQQSESNLEVVQAGLNGSSPMEEQYPIPTEKQLSTRIVDRSKIQKVQRELNMIINQLQKQVYRGHQYYYETMSRQCLQNLSAQELTQSKIPNMLSYIKHKLQTQFNHHQDLLFLKNLHLKIKQRIITDLYDTSYYQQHINIVNRNKQLKKQYENSVIQCLRNNYNIKGQFAILFAIKISSQISNGSLVQDKQLLKHLKEKKIDLSTMINKVAIDRMVESLVTRYE